MSCSDSFIIRVSRVVTALLVLTFAAAGCGGGGGGDEACSTLKVAGGRECDSDNNPVVLLSLDGTGLCSGTIVTTTSVITAAHCIKGVRSIRVQHRNASEAASQAYYSRGYTSGVHPYDLAIVKVSPSFTKAANFSPLPIQLSKDVPPGERVAIFGFGQNENGDVSVDLPRAGFLRTLGLVSGMIAAEMDDGFGLRGDSGGPLVFENALLGVFSGFSEEPPVNLFVNLRDPANLAFLREVAGDIAVKSAPEHSIRIDLEASARPYSDTK